MGSTSFISPSGFDSGRGLAPDPAAPGAHRVSIKATTTPLVAQLTVRAIQTALEKTNVNLPGTSERAAVLELDTRALAIASQSSKAYLGSEDAITRSAEVLKQGATFFGGSQALDAVQSSGAQFNEQLPQGFKPNSPSDSVTRAVQVSSFASSNQGEVQQSAALPKLDGLRIQVNQGTFVIDHRALALQLVQQ